jgi:hypothetical protein
LSDGIRSLDRLVVDSPPNDRRIDDAPSLELPSVERPPYDRLRLEPLWLPSLNVRVGLPLKERLERSPPPLNDRDDSPPLNDLDEPPLKERIDSPPPLNDRGDPPLNDCEERPEVKLRIDEPTSPPLKERPPPLKDRLILLPLPPPPPLKDRLMLPPPPPPPPPLHERPPE